MQIPSLVEMLQAGLHFGHQTARWHPKMKPFIFTQRNGVHIIDLEKTQEKLTSVLETVKTMAKEGKIILFVSTKPQAREIVKAAAIDCGMPFLVDRWIGGLLTNFSEMKKMITTYVSMKEQQTKGELGKYTKKEQLEISKDLEKKDQSLVGLTELTRLPDAIFVPAVQREKTAVIEANAMGVDVVGITDSNANPNLVKYFVPGNDDAVKSITMIVGLMAEAVKEGRAEAEKTEISPLHAKDGSVLMAEAGG